MKPIKTLSILLSISLGANLWFVWTWHKSSVNKQTKTEQAQRVNRLSGKNETQTVNSQQQILQNQNKDQNTPDTLTPSSVITSSTEYSGTNNYRRDQKAYLTYLRSLVKDKAFDVLEYEVSDYLRLYPQDIEGQIIEAQVYYHNKPLNVALVHYQALLSQNLNTNQREQIEELIAINTTRVVQQFSGDGAWDLLATFLEPLVQIDPLNRQYLMALARAYGMQQQFTLMEDVLANFARDDVRANRLRQTVLARLDANQRANQPNQSTASIFEDDLDSSRSADVLLKQRGGHYIAPAQINNASVRLLVDTGASTSAISKAKFDKISRSTVEFLGLFTVNTAGGRIQAPIYKVENFILGEQQLKNTSVLVLPSDNLGRYDGLLGMNILSQFDMSFDASDQTMRLFKK